MSSLDSLQSRAIAASGAVGQVGSDEPVAIRLAVKSTAGAVTSVTTTTATDIEIITATGGTDTYLFSSYATVGTLVDAINADGHVEAKVLDSLRSFATADQFVTGVITASVTDGNTYYDVLVDTSTAFYFAYRLTTDRNVGATKPTAGHRVHLQEFVYYATLGNVTAGGVQVWEVAGTVETQKMGLLSVSATETTENFASGEGMLTSANGNDIVVVVVDDTSLADSADNYLRVIGKLE